MKHLEEREFTIHLHLTAEFPEDYEGDQDGFAWHQQFQQQLRPALLRAIVDILRTETNAEVVPAPRGRNSDEAAELRVSFTPRRRRLL